MVEAAGSKEGRGRGGGCGRSGHDGGDEGERHCPCDGADDTRVRSAMDW